jgi:hypothetical protein
MVLVSAPVDAVADRGPARRQTVRVDAEPGEGRAAGTGERVLDVVAVGRRPVGYGFVGPVDAVVTGEYATFQQATHQGHTEPAGQMAVAGAGPVQGVGAVALLERGDGRRRRDQGEALHGGAHVRAGEPVEAVPAPPLDGEQPALDELGRGLGALETGLALLPSVCMGLAAAPLFSRMASRTGPYVPMAAGLVLGTAGFLGWLLAGPGTPYPHCSSH